jgi:hypothetical protein
MNDQGGYEQGYHAAQEDDRGKLAEVLRLHMGAGESAIPVWQAREIFQSVHGMDAADDEFGQDPVVRRICD